MFDRSLAATFIDNTVSLTSHRMKHLAPYRGTVAEQMANETKSIQVTFTKRRENCPPVIPKNHQLPQSDQIKYHHDRRLLRRKHSFTKRTQLGLKFRQLY